MSEHDDLDLLELAEAVAAGRVGALDAERTVRTRAALDGGRTAEADVRELRSLIAAAGAVRAHAAATREALGASYAQHDTSPEAESGVILPLAVGGARVRRRRESGSMAGSPRIGLLIAATLVVGTSVVAAAVFGGRLLSPNPAPSPTTVAIASVEPSPSESPAVSPEPSPTLSPTVAPSPTPGVAAGIPAIASANLAGAPGVGVWRLAAPTRLEVLVWQSGGSNRRLFETDTWKDPDAAAGQTITRQVLVSPVGDRVVIAETDPQAKTRVRLFDKTGHVLWQTTQTLGIPTLAWSLEANELAVAFVPRPWIVVAFSPDGSVSATTYNLPGDVPVQLLGFTEDGVRLFCYDGSGEAAPWEKPYALDLASGMTETPLSASPGSLAGMVTSSTTTLSWRFDPATGDALDPGDATGRQTDWSIMVNGKRNDTHVPLVVDGTDTGVLWTDLTPGNLMTLVTHRSDVAGTTATNVTLSNVTRSGAATQNAPWSAGQGMYRGFLRAASQRWAVVGLSQLPARADESLGDDELVLVDVSSGQTSTFSVLGGGNFDLHYAGLVQAQ